MVEFGLVEFGLVELGFLHDNKWTMNGQKKLFGLGWLSKFVLVCLGLLWFTLVSFVLAK